MSGGKKGGREEPQPKIHAPGLVRLRQGIPDIEGQLKRLDVKPEAPMKAPPGIGGNPGLFTYPWGRKRD